MDTRVNQQYLITENVDSILVNQINKLGINSIPAELVPNVIHENRKNFPMEHERDHHHTTHNLVDSVINSSVDVGIDNLNKPKRIELDLNDSIRDESLISTAEFVNINKIKKSDYHNSLSSDEPSYSALQSYSDEEYNDDNTLVMNESSLKVESEVLVNTPNIIQTILPLDGE